MKLKATKKEITNNFNKIYLIDYKFGFLPEAFAYNTGYLGWNWDAYNLDGICLIEGIRSFPKHKRLPKEAKKIIEEYKKEVVGANFSERVKIDKKYLDMFIEALSNNN